MSLADLILLLLSQQVNPLSLGKKILLLLIFVMIHALTWLAQLLVPTATLLLALLALVFVTSSWVLIPRVLHAVLTPDIPPQPLEILSTPLLILATAATMAPLLTLGMEEIQAVIITVGMAIPVLTVSSLSLIPGS
ncbi:hypothetical protein CJU75_03220 [Pseudomonas fragi]|nr:hypothetical protein CJU75_03220 [Pseudomonas fragi]